MLFLNPKLNIQINLFVVLIEEFGLMERPNKNIVILLLKKSENYFMSCDSYLLTHHFKRYFDMDFKVHTRGIR